MVFFALPSFYKYLPLVLVHIPYSRVDQLADTKAEGVIEPNKRFMLILYMSTKANLLRLDSAYRRLLPRFLLLPAINVGFFFKWVENGLVLFNG